MTSKVHLPSLFIKDFRGIRSLEINNLGRVTLLAGKNSIGKTTILEAIRVFASRGNGHTILNLLNTREEFFRGEDEDGDQVLFPDFSSLFYGYNPEDENSLPSPIQITTTQRTPHKISLSLVEISDETQSETLANENFHLNDFQVSVDNHTRTFPIIPFEYSHRTGFLDLDRLPTQKDGHQPLLLNL
ncbi:MAG: AAA family ATPase [Aestuariivita sp.]|nr:AAA family ATPase [Aestuariivita sp.]